MIPVRRHEYPATGSVLQSDHVDQVEEDEAGAKVARGQQGEHVERPPRKKASRAASLAKQLPCADGCFASVSTSIHFYDPLYPRDTASLHLRVFPLPGVLMSCGSRRLPFMTDSASDEAQRAVLDIAEGYIPAP